MQSVFSSREKKKKTNNLIVLRFSKQKWWKLIINFRKRIKNLKRQTQMRKNEKPQCLWKCLSKRSHHLTRELSRRTHSVRYWIRSFKLEFFQQKNLRMHSLIWKMLIKCVCTYDIWFSLFTTQLYWILLRYWYVQTSLLVS